MRSRAKLGCLIVIYLLAAACVSGQTQTAVPTTEEIVAQMAQAQAENRTHFHPYVVTRDYKLFEGDNHDHARSRIVAHITVVPPDSKKYTIENPDGSVLGERVVRKILDGEVALAKDSASTEITSENYDFRVVREEELGGQRCYILEMVPKRKSKNLLRGTIWVDSRTYLLRRVEGEPVKNPSWWATNIHIALRYGYVGAMWLQTYSEATANIRILGRSTMIWHDVKYEMSELAPGVAVAIELQPDLAK